MRRQRLLVATLLVLAAACATVTGRRSTPIDLTGPRQAVEMARQAGAAEKAPDTFGQAEAHLKEAEMQPAAAAAHDHALKAEWLARIAIIETRAAATPPPAPVPEVDSSELERINDRLRKSEEQRRRQEERITLLQHDLEVTETEMIRTKARLKGLETKAEASSAIAEAHILMSRLDPKARAASLSHAEQALAKAEQLLQEENYGAALFFAMKAQDIVKAGP
jgi:uncharacterized protein YhaN